MGLSKQILVLIGIIGALLLLNFYDGFIAKQTGKSTHPIEWSFLQD
jgi:hypothetical protein